jgi:hypothetical protein
MTVPPASAARTTFEDRVNDAPRRMDIRTVKVVNAKRIAFHTEFRYLRNRGFNSIYYALYIDTNRRNAGPEYRVAGALFWEVYFNRVDGWNDRNGEFPNCGRGGVRARTTEGRFGTVTWNFSRRCLRGPDEIRVSVEAGDRYDFDAAPRRRTFYPAVDRG